MMALKMNLFWYKWKKLKIWDGGSTHLGVTFKFIAFFFFWDGASCTQYRENIFDIEKMSFNVKQIWDKGACGKPKSSLTWS